MYPENRLGLYLFLVFFTVLTGYTFLLRSSFYDEEGIPRIQNENVQFIGENLAGDYALFRQLERKTPPNEAYQSENISAFLYKAIHINGNFVSFASPMKSFVSVPLLSLSYLRFFETWVFWGILLFGFSLYTFLPLKIAVLLMFSLPAALLGFSTGGWGIFAASAVILALTLTDEYPKLAAFFSALCVVEPMVFALVLAVFFLRNQKKAAFFSIGMAGTIVFLSLSRYGAEAFKFSFLSAWRLLRLNPCSFASFASTLSCKGTPLAAALILQAILIGGVLYYAYRLFRKKDCFQAVQDAYLCAALCLLSPFTVLGDYGLFFAGVAFLFRDCIYRGFLKEDWFFFILAFSSIYLAPLFFQFFGMHIQLCLALLLLRISYNRSY